MTQSEAFVDTNPAIVGTLFGSDSGRDPYLSQPLEDHARRIKVSGTFLVDWAVSLP